MTQPVNIKGVGIVEFEDGMTPEQIEAAIVNDILPKFQSQPGQPQPDRPLQKEDPLAGDDSAFRRVSDVGIDLAKGAVGLVDTVTGLGDIVSGGRVGKFTDEVSEDLFGGTTDDLKEYLDKGTSRQGLRAEREVAEAEGFGETFEAMIRNPSTILGTVAESLPGMIGGAKIAQGLTKLGKLKRTNAAGKEVPNYVGTAGVGEGIIGAGQQATDIRRQTDDQTLSGTQAVLSGLTGVFTGILGSFGAKMAQKLGVVDADILLSEGVAEGTKRGVINNAIRAGISEGLFEELPQSVQEQVLNNVALGKDPMEGVGEAAATGILAGIGMGGGATLATNSMQRQIEMDKERLKETFEQNKTEDSDDKPSIIPNVIIPPKSQAKPQVEPQVEPQAQPQVKKTKEDKEFERIDKDYEKNKLEGESQLDYNIRTSQTGGQNVQEETDTTTETQQLSFEQLDVTGAGTGSAFFESGQSYEFDPGQPIGVDGRGLVSPRDTSGGFNAAEETESDTLNIEEIVDEIPSVEYEERTAQGKKYAKDNKLKLHPFEISGSKYAARSPLQDKKINFSDKPNKETIQQKAIEDAAYILELEAYESIDNKKVNEQIEVEQDKIFKRKEEEQKKELKKLKNDPNNPQYKTFSDKKLKTVLYRQRPDLKSKQQKDKEGDIRLTFPQALETKEYNKKVAKIYEDNVGKGELEDKSIETDIKNAKDYVNTLNASAKQKVKTERKKSKQAIKKFIVDKKTSKQQRIDDIKEKKVDKDLEALDKESELFFSDIELDKRSKRSMPSNNTVDPVIQRQATTVSNILDALLDNDGNPGPPINIKKVLDEISNLIGVNGAIAKRLLVVDSNTKIQAGDVKNNEAGQFDPANNLITINIKLLDGNFNIKKIDLPNVILHETMHSSLDHVIDNTSRYNYLSNLKTKTDAQKAEMKDINQAISPAQRKAVEEIRNIRNQLRKFYAQEARRNVVRREAPLESEKKFKKRQDDAALNAKMPVGLREEDDLNEFVAYIFEGSFNNTVEESLQEKLRDINQYQLLTTDRKDGKVSPAKRKKQAEKKQGFFEKLQTIYDNLKNTFIKALGFTEGRDASSSLAAIATQVDIILNPDEFIAARFKGSDYNAVGLAGITGEKTRFREGKPVGQDADGDPVDRTWKIGKTKEEIAGRKKIKTSQKEVIKAEKIKTASMTADEMLRENAKDQRQRNLESEGTLKKIGRNLSNTENVRRLFQNKRAPLKLLEDALRRANKLIFSGEGNNNISSILDLAFGRADFLYRQNLMPVLDRYKRTIGQYLKYAKSELNLNEQEAMSYLHDYLEALHEPERREISFIKNVPLDDETTTGKILTWTDGTKVSPAQYRLNILEEISSNPNLSSADIKVLRNNLNTIVAQYANINGSSPRASLKGNPEALNKNSTEYDVTLKNHEAQQKMRDELNADPQTKAIVEEIKLAQQPVHKVTRQLNKMGNYANDFSENIIEFYGFENYIPLKGKPPKKGDKGSTPAQIALLEEYNYSGERLGTTLRQVPIGFESRTSDSTNGVTQTIVDAIHSTARAGRAGLTEAIQNAIKQGHIDGIAVVENISFVDRATRGMDALNPEKLGENKILHYKDDGSIDIVQINSRKLLTAIREPIQEMSPLIDYITEGANKVTSMFGQYHTRYNPAFPVLNFVRDFITNFFIIAAENPAAVPRYAYEIASQILTSPAALINLVQSKYTIGKAGQINRAVSAYVQGDISKLESLAKSKGKNSTAANMLEFLEAGGNVSYIQSLATSTQLDDIIKKSSRGPDGIIVQARDSISSFFDMFVNSMELAVRVAAYKAIKSNRIANGSTKESAIKEAVAYSKNLANFEQTGEYGRGLGAAFMFFRPAATGAVRALDAISPAIRTLFRPLGSSGMQGMMDSQVPDSIKNDPAALAAWKQNYSKDVKYGSIVIIGALGFGYAIYQMSKAMGGEDEEERNRIDIDDMGRWTRFARFDIGNEMFQMPWGFGLGGLAAIGAQLGALEDSSYTETPKILRNIMEITLDSFLPIPISRIDFTKDGLSATKAAFDTVTPSAIRPIFQFMMNTSGMDYQIYNATSRYGQSYAGGDNTPQMYKDASEWFANATGTLWMNPDLLYFFSNNYFDGPTRIMQNMYEADLLINGKQLATPDSISKASMVFDSFISTQTEVAPRDFAYSQRKVKDAQSKLDTYSSIADSDPSNPILYNFLNKPENINLESALDTWNKNIGGSYKVLQTELNDIRQDRSLSPKVKNTLIKEKKKEINRKKREILIDLEMYAPNLVKSQ